ncbi:nicotinate-nucleotide adenylyltransferase [Jannaschia sp. W003]|uniref:nicotinate-nucleotide adenylyltransferase n=1 Tax=Jannaschia sp. W003 TaxID=2867012 RepID=UPI0021A51180|nr:nicotinate-nucleotide adenylyltransferase [Jannaschia sp. W003]UWQ21815.1 nicotinate-nucleotide adenylyltransferase [Jannaschia sp. W003]
MRIGLPPTRPGQVVGLLGGSFDPAHAGHVHVSLEALKRFRLDRLWWLVSPGNPLKARGPAPLARRVAHARALMRHPKVQVTAIEARLRTRYTAHTLRRLRGLMPGVRFVWIMGADNLAQLHLWEDWRGIMETTPVGVVARPGERMAGRMSPAAHAFRRFQLPEAQAGALGRTAPPAWCLVNVPMHPASSTAIRAAGRWG